jgi:hypothetical protein
MFRAQSNIFDDVVVKATDENLTSENWEYILVRLTTPGVGLGLLAGCCGSVLACCRVTLSEA